MDAFRKSNSERIIAFLVTVVTLYEIASLLYGAWGWIGGRTENAVAIGLAGLGLLAVFAVAVLTLQRYFLWPLLARDFELPRRPLNKIVFDQMRSYTISPEGARASFTGHMIFLQEPGDEDRVDIFDVEGQKIADTFQYTSADSVERRRIYLAESRRVKIYWKPKTIIEPFVPYTHEKSFFMPDEYDSKKDGGYVFDILVDSATGRIRFDVVTHVPIGRAVVVKYPKLRRLKTIERVFAYASKTRETVGPAPQIRNSTHVQWTGTGLEVGARYGLIIFFRPSRPPNKSVQPTPRSARGG